MEAYHPYSMAIPVCYEILQICWLEPETTCVGNEKMGFKQDKSTEGWESQVFCIPPFIILSLVLINYPSYWVVSVMDKVGKSRHAFSGWGGRGGGQKIPVI